MKAVLQVGRQVAGGPLATVHRGLLGGRAVAVKQARPEVAGAAAALRREARILGATSHPALVPLIEVLDDSEAPAVVLGWADGGSLDDLLADGPIGDDDVIHLLRPVAAALDALHQAGVAHLDVSPRNLLLAAAGPVLIDPAPPGGGTPGYTDPAVAAGGLASARSDVFGLAACAHVAMSGRHPRAGGGAAVGLALPTAVSAVLTAGLDPDPRRRPSSSTSFIDCLVAVLLPAATASAPVARRHPTGRPVTRSREPMAGAPRTWPFERWQEEADAAASRRQRAVVSTPPPRRKRRRPPKHGQPFAV